MRKAIADLSDAMVFVLKKGELKIIDKEIYNKEIGENIEYYS